MSLPRLFITCPEVRNAKWEVRLPESVRFIDWIQHRCAGVAFRWDASARGEFQVGLATDDMHEARVIELPRRSSCRRRPGQVMRAAVGREPEELSQEWSQEWPQEEWPQASQDVSQDLSQDWTQEWSQDWSHEWPDFFCDSCDVGFQTAEEYQQHEDASHAPCLEPGCSFSAPHNSNALATHALLQQQGEDTAAEDEAWVAARRRNFPCRSNLESRELSRELARLGADSADENEQEPRPGGREEAPAPSALETLLWDLLREAGNEGEASDDSKQDVMGAGEQEANDEGVGEGDDGDMSPLEEEASEHEEAGPEDAGGEAEGRYLPETPHGKPGVYARDPDKHADGATGSSCVSRSPARPPRPPRPPPPPAPPAPPAHQHPEEVGSEVRVTDVQAPAVKRPRLKYETAGTLRSCREASPLNWKQRERKKPSIGLAPKWKAWY